MLSKEQAIALFPSRKALQIALGLKSHAAISMWADGQPIPAEHELRLRYELKPECFDADGKVIEKARAA